MKDFIFRIMCLPKYLYDGFKAWKACCWDVDLDAVYCCTASGEYPCQCGGDTNRTLLRLECFKK